MNFAEIIVPRPLIIRLKREEESLNNIKQYYVRCSNQQEKYSAVTNIYGTVGVGQAIIFCHVSTSSIVTADFCYENSDLGEQKGTCKIYGIYSPVI